MATSKTVFICRNCGHKAHKWVGQCPDCSEWNAHDEELAEKIATAPVAMAETPRPITEITSVDYEAVPTGIGELDRVLGTLYEVTERCFRPAMRIGYASKFGG